MASSKNLTQGPIFKNVFLFSLPLMATNVLQVLFNMSDVAVVGKFGADTALGSVGSTTMIVNLFTGFMLGIGGGVNAIVARKFGAKDEEGVKTSVNTAFYMSLAIGAILLIAGLIVARPFLNLLGTKSELIDGAHAYLKIYFWGMPALALYNFGQGVLSAMGDTKKPLIFLLISGITNVLLNLFFVIVMKLDVKGVAIATIISLYLSATLILVSLIKVKDVYRLTANLKLFDTTALKNLLMLSVSAGLQNSIFAVANLFIQSAVNTFDAVIVSANSAAQNLDPLVYDVMAAFYTAATSFVAQNYGAMNKERVKKSYIAALTFSASSAIVLGAGFALFGRQFLLLFTDNKAVVEEGIDRLKIMAFSYFISAFMDCSIAASRGLNKTLLPAAFSIMGSCVFRIIWIYTVFAHFNTLASLYLLYAFSWSITGISETVYFVYVYKKTFKNAPAKPIDGGVEISQSENQ